MFASFFGTMKLSDSPATCMSAGWLVPSPTDPKPWQLGMPPGSLGFRGKGFQPCWWSLTPWGQPELAVTLDVAVAFPLSGRGRPPKRMFSELDTLPSCASVNASRRRLLDATHHSRSGRLARTLPRAALPAATLPRLTPTHPDTFSASFSGSTNFRGSGFAGWRSQPFDLHLKLMPFDSVSLRR